MPTRDAAARDAGIARIAEGWHTDIAIFGIIHDDDFRTCVADRFANLAEFIATPLTEGTSYACYENEG